MTSRVLDPETGVEALRLGIAQRYLFRDQRVTPDGPPLTRHFSDVLVTGSSIGNDGVAGIVTIKYAGQGSMPVPEQISVEWVGGKPRLRWSNPAFVLQSAPTAIGPFKTTVGAVSPHPLSAIDRLEFYRLKFAP